MKDSRLVILSALGVKFFDFEALKKTKIQLILVLDEREKDLLPTEILHHFAAIHLLPASQETDVTIVFDYEAAKKLIQALLQTAPAAHWQLVSLSEVNLISVAKLNTYFGFPTPSPETLELYRDKCKMKDHLHKQGIRVPHHCVIDQETARQNPTAYFQKLVHEVGLPMIIKPSDSAGSFNVEKIHGEKEFLAWLPTIENDNFTYEAEEFVNGVLYHCDTAIENGEVIFSECCEYSCPNLEFKKNKNMGSIMLLAKDPLRERMLNFAHEVLNALGRLNTVTHMEMFLTPEDEIIFLEVGARPAGATIQALYKHNFDLNLSNVYLRALLGIPYDFTNEVKGHSFWMFLPKPNGTIAEYTNPTLKSVYEIEWLVKRGEHTQVSLSVVDIAAKIFAHNINNDILSQDFRSFLSFQPFTMK